MKSASFLDQIRVASPCLARWEDMSGDERVRFCGQCRKHVYNLSELTADEAENLVREREGRLCARFHQRVDGTVLTADCPAGAARKRQRVRRFALVTVLGAMLGGSLVSWAAGRSSDPSSARRSRFAATWDAAVWKVKDWLGIQPPPARMLLGEVCIPPPAPTPPPPALPPTP